MNTTESSARAESLQRLGRSPLPRLLFVSHGLGGGVERHVRDLASLIEGHCEVLLLQPSGQENELTLSWLRTGESFRAWFSGSGDYPYLIEFLRTLGVQRVHLHHIDGLPQAVLSLVATLGVPLDVTLHDHFPLTSQYHLGPGGVLPARTAAHPWGWDASEWRTRMHTFLRGAARIICPSKYLREQVAAAYPDLSIVLWPHPEPAFEPSPESAKVLILGRTTATKGLDVVLACARDAAARNLPLSFYILGPTDRAVPDLADLPLSIYGSYHDEKLDALIAEQRADAFLFPAQIPESYGYTLSAALNTGLPIVASRLGAFTERLEGRSDAKLLAWDSPAAAWNEALLQLAPKPVRAPSRPNAGNQSAGNQNAYAQNYLAALKNIGIKPVDVSLKALFLSQSRHAGGPAELSLADLYAAGVDSGQEESRRELKRRVGVVDEELAATRAALRQRDRDVEELGQELQGEHQRYRALEEEREEFRSQLQETQATMQDMEARLEAERDAARAAYAGIEQSTSWRVTAPLRSLMEFVKSLRYRLGDLRGNARRLPQQMNTARQILKEQGPVALGRRVQEKLTRKSEAVPAPVSYIAEAAMAPLALTESAAPRFSVIVPVYEQHLLTFTCLKSIAATCAAHEIEVIVIDDCSPTPAAEALAMVTGVRFVRNETNLGFLRNCNKAAGMARGEYIVLLNNDTIATGDWLGAMHSVFEHHEKTGMVGAKLIYPDGSLQEAGGIVWRDGSAWNYGRNDNAAKPEYNYVREADYCSGACLMLTRSLWNELGGFDERYVPAYYEDTDLAFRVRAAGLKVVYQPAAVIVHFEGKSSGTDLTRGIKQYQVTNQRNMIERWRDTLAGHRLNGVAPERERERERSAHRRVLVVDACMLTPDQDSGSLRMFEMLGQMHALGCKVSFVADNLEYREPYVSQIQQLGVEVLYHPYISSMTGLLERTAGSYDVIMLSRATVAVKYVELVKRVAPRAKLVFDTVDLHFLRQERQAELEPNAAARAAAEAMKKQELDIIAQSDVTLVVSPVEQELLDRLAPASRIAVVSNVHVNMPGEASFNQRSGVIFIGGFRHPPNLDAISWYAEEVLPILRRKAPGLITTVIGSNAPPALQKFAANDFVIAGFVPDVTDYYGQARLSISPLRYGAGVKGKVNLSMQYGVPVVATTVSVEGMYLKDGENVRVADDPEAFADAVIRVHGDAELWTRLSQGGLDNIEAYFSRACARRALAGVLDLA